MYTLHWIWFNIPCLDFTHCQEIVDRNKENHGLGNIALIFSIGFDHLEECFSLEEVQCFKFLLSVKSNYFPAENINETPAIFEMSPNS